MVIVFWQRYPSDPISSRSFADASDADTFYRNKSEDYRYTTGSVWIEEYERKTSEGGRSDG